MKISDHTVYAPNRTPKLEKTSVSSVSSVFSVVNESTCGYVDNEIIINEVVATELGISKSQITGLGANGLIDEVSTTHKGTKELIPILNSISKFLTNLTSTARQLAKARRWAIILSRSFIRFLKGREIFEASDGGQLCLPI